MLFRSMGALLSVAKGSKEPPKFIVLHHRGASKKEKPVVLIGKGVAALQKVGFLQLTPLSMPRIDVLGVCPSVQTIAAQVAVLLIIIASVAYNLRGQRTARG